MPDTSLLSSIGWLPMVAVALVDVILILRKNTKSGYHRSRSKAAFTLAERELDRQGLRGGGRGLYAR